MAARRYKRRTKKRYKKRKKSKSSSGDACLRKVRASFKRRGQQWPSAYGSAAVSLCRKRQGNVRKTAKGQYLRNSLRKLNR